MVLSLTSSDMRITLEFIVHSKHINQIKALDAVIVYLVKKPTVKWPFPDAVSFAFVCKL